MLIWTCMSGGGFIFSDIVERSNHAVASLIWIIIYTWSSEFDEEVLILCQCGSRGIFEIIIIPFQKLRLMYWMVFKTIHIMILGETDKTIADNDIIVRYFNNGDFSRYGTTLLYFQEISFSNVTLCTTITYHAIWLHGNHKLLTSSVSPCAWHLSASCLCKACRKRIAYSYVRICFFLLNKKKHIRCAAHALFVEDLYFHYIWTYRRHVICRFHNSRSHLRQRNQLTDRPVKDLFWGGGGGGGGRGGGVGGGVGGLGGLGFHEVGG